MWIKNEESSLHCLPILLFILYILRLAAFENEGFYASLENFSKKFISHGNIYVYKYILFTMMHKLLNKNIDINKINTKNQALLVLN